MNQPSERDEVLLFIRRVVHGGSIVSTAGMTPTQIAIARSAGRMLVTPDGFGFVYVPGPVGLCPVKEHE